jgi:hypothetical protein
VINHSSNSEGSSTSALEIMGYKLQNLALGQASEHELGFHQFSYIIWRNVRDHTFISLY